MKTQFDIKLLIYVYADLRYYMFVVPYIYFALTTSPNAFVEVVLENKELYLSLYKKSIENLKKYFSNFAFSQSEFSKEKYPKIMPNSIRFLQNPQIKAEYLYIGDIDILLLNNVYEVHTNLMSKYNLPFSNVVRKTNPPRLTGLHFTKFDLHFPINLDELANNGININQNDEELLYNIYKYRKIPIDYDFNIRPMLGIHCSKGRVPTNCLNDGRPTWTYESVDTYKKIFNSEMFREMYFTFDIEMQSLFLIINSVIDNTFERLSLCNFRYGINRSYLQELDKNVNMDSLYEKRSQLLKDHDYFNALCISRDIYCYNPFYLKNVINYIYSLIKVGNLDKAYKLYLLHKDDNGIANQPVIQYLINTFSKKKT